MSFSYESTIGGPGATPVATLIDRALHSLVRRHFPERDPGREIERIRQWAEQTGSHLVLTGTAEAFRLREIPDCPPLLFVRGNPALLGQSAVAVVGTRTPSAYGMRAALHFSRALAERGFCIISGLARGIDGCAHRGALMVGGFTVAVVAHGLDRVYPASHRGLNDAIVDRGGCVLSEYPPGVPPLKHHFPRRNRLLSGLALGTLVVQAAERSGSLITARHALEQNREIFVVPGVFDDATFAGSHRLVQEGGKLVTTVEQIIEEFPPDSSPQPDGGSQQRLTKPMALPGGVESGAAELMRSEQRTETVDDDLADRWRAKDEVMPLAQLLAEGVTLACIERALRDGRCVEVFPQHLVWVGN